MSDTLLSSRNEYYKAKETQLRLQDAWSVRRLEMEAIADGDPEFAAAILQQCKDDPLFFFDHFLWTFDPRAKRDRQNVPFIPYPYQRELIMWMHRSILETQGTPEGRNLLVEKSRDMGASWCMLGYFLWNWLFHEGSFLILSRKEEEVDKRGDMDTPFEKIRYMLYRLPKWLIPKGFIEREHDKFLLLKNPKGGEIAGESANPNAGRGGRKLAVLFDEQQSMGNDDASYRACAQTTNVRISVGTPAGPVGKYYRLATGQKGEEKVDKRRLHWSLHPEKGAGAKMIDGKLSSYWYEKQKERMSEEDIAAELDISYATSVKGLIFKEYTELHRWQPPSVQLIASTLKFGEEYAPMLRVWDPGVRVFANLFMQKDRNGRALPLKENLTEMASIHDVAQQVQELSTWFQRKLKPKRWEDCGDPAGASRSNSAQEDPEYTILREEYDIDVDYLFMSDMSSKLRVKSRISAIKGLLQKICAKTETPYMVVNVSECKILDEALSQKYRWKIDRHTKQVFEGRVAEEHPYEDVVDCLGYGVVYWWGLGNRGLNPSSDSRNQIGEAEIDWDYR